jgi:thymidylate synthase ThyX
MNFESGYETFTEEQSLILNQYVTDCQSHIFAIKNLPEVIKGALFSRYSRSYLGLRSLLLKEFIGAQEGLISSNTLEPLAQEEAILKAQSFYDRILDGYGDDSIGELGGCHLALENVSMLAAKEIEDARIGGSPLEKSTRYLCFDRPLQGKFAYYREPMLMQSEFASRYELTCDFLFQTYSRLIEPLTIYIKKNFPKSLDISENAYQAALRAKVLDCLRGLLPASTLTNLGVFGNGRFFEKLLTELGLADLAEMNSISSKSFEQLSKVIPSFIRRANSENKHWKPTELYNRQMHQVLKQAVNHKPSLRSAFKSNSSVKLINSDPEALKKVTQALLFEYSSQELSQIEVQNPLALFNQLANIRTNRRHKAPRAFEHAFYTFEIESDFGCYRDLQRHRTLTQERQLLGCSLGFIIPQEIESAGLSEPYQLALQQAADTYYLLSENMPKQAQYVVPMAFKVRWYFHINLRALQWVCELRSGPAGHSEYRFVAQEMARLVMLAQPEFSSCFKFVDFEGHSLGRLDQETRRANQQGLC